MIPCPPFYHRICVLPCRFFSRKTEQVSRDLNPLLFSSSSLGSTPPPPVAPLPASRNKISKNVRYVCLLRVNLPNICSPHFVACSQHSAPSRIPLPAPYILHPMLCFFSLLCPSPAFCPSPVASTDLHSVSCFLMP